MIQSLQATFISTNLNNYSIHYSTTVCYIASSLQRVHRIWQTYVRGQAYRNPDNWLGLAIGHLTKFHYGTNMFVQLAAAPFFITSRILDFFEQEDRVVVAYETWKGALKGRYTFIDDTILVKESKFNYLISRYRITKWKQNYSILTQRMHMIFFSSIALLIELFKLVMRFMDVLELFTLDAEKMKKHVERAIVEGGLTIPRVLKVLCNNRGLFLTRLEKIEKTFLKIVQNDKAKQSREMISFSRTFFDQLEMGLNIYNSASKISGEKIVTFFKGYFIPPSFENFMREFFYDPSKPASHQNDLFRPPVFSLGIKTVSKREVVEYRNKIIQPKPYTPVILINTKKHDEIACDLPIVKLNSKVISETIC